MKTTAKKEELTESKVFGWLNRSKKQANTKINRWRGNLSRKSSDGRWSLHWVYYGKHNDDVNELHLIGI